MSDAPPLTTHRRGGRLRLLGHLTWWDLVSQYFGSWAGVLWNVIMPALIIGIYLLVFELTPGFRFGGRETVGGYGVNLVAGLVPWLLFQEGLARASSAFVDNRHLLTQIPVPPALFPLANVASALARHVVAILLFVGVLLATGHSPGPTWAALFVAGPILLALTAAGAVAAAVGTVLQRDVAPTVQAALLPLFFATPIIYPAHIAPGPLRAVMDLNPLTPVVLAYRDALVTGRWPAWDGLLYSAGCAAIVGLGAWIALRRVGPELAERM